MRFRISLFVRSDKYEFRIDRFRRCAADTVHPLNPFHWIFRFELFGQPLTLRHFLYEPKEHFFRLLVEVIKVSVELSACEQIVIQQLPVPFQIPHMPLSPDTDSSLFFGW